MRNRLCIIGLTILMTLSLLACGPAPATAPVTAPVPQEPTVASNPAGVVEVVQVGMAKSDVEPLIDGSKFAFEALQLADYSNKGGQVSMLPRAEGSSVPATYIVWFFAQSGLTPAYIVFDNSWVVIATGRIPLETVLALLSYQ